MGPLISSAMEVKGKEKLLKMRIGFDVKILV
jgi:hypothetical protein